MFLPDQSTIDLVDIQSVDDAAAALVAVSAAPSDAQYIVATVNGTLSAEQSLGALTTGLLKNTVASSVGTLSAAVAGTDYVAPGATTTSGLTMATARILGRSTASTGAIEEISIGSGLSLSGGTLSASGGGAVSSVFGRTGAVTAANNDYTWAQIDKTTSSLADIATRSASDLSSGTLAAARGGAGTVSGILKADGAGLVSAASAGTDYEVPLTFSTGLTRSTNTITVNTSQNIATLSNLTSNGLVTTSGGAGTLGVTVPGTGVLTALAVNIGSAGAPVLFDGAGGTPSSLTLTNATGLPLSTGVTGDLPFANFVQAGSAGFVGATGAGDYSHRTPAQVTAALDNFVGDSGGGGTKGLVPAPASGDAAANKYLKADGTWATVSGGSGITVGTTTVTSGTATRLFYETAGNVVGQVSGVTSDGTNVTAGSGNLRATSPRITTGINDANGNTLLGITANASATEYITIGNNTATNAVSLTASSPTVAASAQAGTPLNLTASPAIAGNVNVGAAAGGSVTITAGAAARLTSGNANGGDINLLTGTGIGTGRAGVLFVPPGSSSGVPGIAFSSSGSVLNGMGVYSSGVNIITNGGTWLWVNAGGGVATGSTNPFAWSSTTDAAGTKDTYIRRNAAANIALGTTDAAAPVAQTLSVQNVVGGTSNTAGANWTINASRGTGTGAGGSIIFQTAPAGGSGTTQNTLAAAFTVNGDGSVSLKSVTFANLPTQANAKMIYCSDCTIASPCASGGSGAMAKGINGAWVCN